MDRGSDSRRAPFYIHTSAWEGGKRRKQQLEEDQRCEVARGGARHPSRLDSSDEGLELRESQKPEEHEHALKLAELVCVFVLVRIRKPDAGSGGA